MVTTQNVLPYEKRRSYGRVVEPYSSDMVVMEESNEYSQDFPSGRQAVRAVKGTQKNNEGNRSFGAIAIH